jgi:hypothetical protein
MVSFADVMKDNGSQRRVLAVLLEISVFASAMNDYDSAGLRLQKGPVRGRAEVWRQVGRNSRRPPAGRSERIHFDIRVAMLAVYIASVAHAEGKAKRQVFC